VVRDASDRGARKRKKRENPPALIEFQKHS